MNSDVDRRGHTLEVAESWRRERPDLDLSEFLLAIYFRRLGRVLDDAYDRMCRARFDISGADMRVLFALRRAGSPYLRRPTELFRALLVTSGAITKQVDRLQGMGLVERLPGPRKSGGVQLTGKGLKVANAATEVLARNSPLSKGIQGLSKSQLAQCQAAVQQILVALEAVELVPAELANPPAGTRRKKRARS